MATLRQQLIGLIDGLSPEVEKAFLDAIEGIRSQIVLREIVARLEARDIEGAIRALHVDEAAFQPLAEAMRHAFNQGGALTVQNMPRMTDPQGGRVVVRWDMSNQRAEAIIRELSSTLITAVTEDTKQMAREKIEAGYAKGQGPNTIALDLAGRVSPVTKRREGGILGCTAQLARTVESARESLLSGDIAGMRHYLTLGRRNKLFDRTVAKAIREGTPLPPEVVTKIVGKLADSYVKLRAETISRTETAMSVNAAQHEAFNQSLERAGRDQSLVTRKWKSAGDSRVRHTHMVLNNQEVRGMDLPFEVNGAMMRFPGDTSMGAGPAFVLNCRCMVQYNFDFAEAYARSRGR